MKITVIQWCDTVDQVFELLMKPAISLKELWDVGCHWTPPHMPIQAILIEVISEIKVKEITFHLVKFESKVLGSEIGFTLLPVIQN